MSHLPNGFPSGYDARPYGYLPHQIPRSYHRQPGSPTDRGSPDAGGDDYSGTHSPFHEVEDNDLELAILASRAHPMGGDPSFLHSGSTSTSYGPRGAGNRIPGPSGTMSLPTDLTSAHGFPSNYHPMYAHNIGVASSSSQYGSSLAHMQGLSNALSVDMPNSMMYAASSAGSDTESGDSYGSHSPSSVSPPPSMLQQPTPAETEAYLRKTLDIPAHLPVDLRALPEYSEKKQPPITHMIKLAIWGSPHKRLTLRQIYDEIEKRFPALKDLRDKPWQRSIRHNLSLKAIFVRVERPASDPGKGHYWAIDISQGEGNKRDRKRKDGPRSLSRSSEDEDYSEELDDDRPSLLVLGGRAGERRGGHQALRIPQENQYAAGPSMYPQPSGSMMQSSPHSRSAYHPSMAPSPGPIQPYPTLPMTMQLPMEMGRNSPMPGPSSNYTIPSNIEHRPVRRNATEPVMGRGTPLPTAGYIQGMPNTMGPMLSDQPDMQMLHVGYQTHSRQPSGTGSRRPAPDADEETPARSARRHRTR